MSDPAQSSPVKSDNLRFPVFSDVKSTGLREISSTWRSPSNIAIIKYWGKHGVQLPRNASLSFTLDQAFTQTRIRATPLSESSSEPSFEFFFEGGHRPDFESKIRKYLQGIRPFMPVLDHLQLRIESSNSFPHSAGIASSASSMSALALCLCDIEYQLFDAPRKSEFTSKASYLARLGSGSAARSVYGGVTVWGKSDFFSTGTDEYAVPLTSGLHPSFSNLRDAILIVNKSEKEVSSRAGHALMENHPMAPYRFQQADHNLKAILPALASGDWPAFGKICEAEALMLHALMMTSDPSFVLMRPGTLAVIEKVRAFRKAEGIALYFTLDAGPNVHLLYPRSGEDQVVSFIESELRPFCSDGKVIYDRCGPGPQKISDRQ